MSGSGRAVTAQSVLGRPLKLTDEQLKAIHLQKVEDERRKRGGRHGAQSAEAFTEIHLGNFDGRYGVEIR